MPYILTRSVLREVMRWYTAGLALFLILQLTDVLSTTVGLLLDNHASISEALTAFGAYAPTIINRSLALAVPFAVLLAFGRLQGDSEIKAMFAAGVRPLSLVWPLALPFALVGVVAFINAGYIEPSGLERWDRAWYTIYGTTPPPLNQENYTFSPPKQLFYAGRVRGDTKQHTAQLEGVLVQKGDETVTALTGVWDTQKKTWTVHHPWISRSGKDPEQTNTPMVFQQTDTFVPPLPPANKVSTPDLQARLTRGTGTPQEKREDQFELATRYADPCTAVVFALAAGILGLLLRNRAAAFAAVLVFLVVFYALWVTVPQFAKAGAMQPNLAAWTPNFVFLLIAAVLAWRLR